MRMTCRLLGLLLVLLYHGRIVAAGGQAVLGFEEALKRADRGDAFAQAVVALHYQLGWDTEMDPARAYRYAAASAGVGHPLGQFRLGALLRAGQGVPKAEKEGLALQQLAVRGLKTATDPYSFTALGILIFQGKVVGQGVAQEARYREAARLYKAAADAGYAPAEFNYAMCCEAGHGVAKDAGAAVAALQRAVEKRYPLAIAALEGKNLKVGSMRERIFGPQTSKEGVWVVDSESHKKIWLPAMPPGLSVHWSKGYTTNPDPGTRASSLQTDEAQGDGILKLIFGGKTVAEYTGEMREGRMDGLVGATYLRADGQTLRYNGQMLAFWEEGLGRMELGRGGIQYGRWKRGQIEFAEQELEGKAGEDDWRWAYEFLPVAEGWSHNLTAAGSGRFAYCDEEWTVRTFIQSTHSGFSQTDFLFYDTRTLELRAHLRCPNVVTDIARIGTTQSFALLLRVSFKDRYYDQPAVVVLVEPVSHALEKVILPLEQFRAQDHHLRLKTAEDSVVVQYGVEADSDWRSDPITRWATPGQFQSVSLSLSAQIEGRDIPVPGQRVWGEKVGENAWEREVSSLRGDRSALQSAGLEARVSGWMPHVWADVSGRQTWAGDVTGNTAAAIHLVHASADGGLFHLDGGRLRTRSARPGIQRMEGVGALTDGTVYGRLGDELLWWRESALERVALPFPPARYDPQRFDRRLAFTENAAFSWVTRALLGEQPVALEVCRLRPGLQPEPVRMPAEVARLGEMEEAGFCVPGEMFVKVRHPNPADHDESIFEVYPLRGGKPVLSLERTISRGGFAEGFSLGRASEGWRVLAVTAGTSTGGTSYNVCVEHLRTGTRLWPIGLLPALPDLLEFRASGESGNLLCAHQGKAVLVRMPLGDLLRPGPKNQSDIFLDEKRSVQIAEWRSPVDESGFHFVPGRNLLIVPKHSGFDAVRVFNGGKPELVFSAYFSGEETYAIVLPNGIYAGSRGCETFLRLKDRRNVRLEASALAPWRNRPAEILKALGGDLGDIEVLEGVTQRWLNRLGVDVQRPEPAAADLASVSVPALPPLWASSPAVRFQVDLKPGSESVREVLVRVNGVLVQRFDESKRRTLLDVEVTLAEGQNWVEVSALDALGRSSNLVRFRSVLREPAAPAVRYVVAMGVSKYRDPALNLAFAAKDASDLGEVLRQAGGPRAALLILRDEEVNVGTPRRIRDFLAPARENDEVIVFCAGHGMLDENLDYLYAGHDFDVARPGQTGIALEELVGAVGSCAALKRLLLLDTCHAGQVGEKEQMLLAHSSASLPPGVRAVQKRGLQVRPVAGLTGEMRQRFIEELFLLPGGHRGLNILGASGGAEYALESAQWSNGVFTASLIEAVRDGKGDSNGDGRLTVSELRAYLAARVGELTGGAQKPSVVAFEPDQNFPLTHRKSRGEKDAATHPILINLGAVFTNSLGLKFVPIPKTGVYCSTWSTRVSDYAQFVKATGREWKAAGFPQKADHPAVRVSHFDATAFCDWLTQVEHRIGKLPRECQYRLPTDAEWSAAIGLDEAQLGPPAWRAFGIPNCYPWGSSWPPPKGVGNFDPRLRADSYPYTSPVGSFPANRFGLFDMSGNVLQWIREDFDENGQGFLRGSSWPDETQDALNLTARMNDVKTSAYKCYGFRCVIGQKETR